MVIGTSFALTRKVENLISKESDAMTHQISSHVSQRNSAPFHGSQLVPRTWNRPHEHFSAALDSVWYRLLFRLYGKFVSSTHAFFASKQFTPSLMPITCGSVSSPMGLGSDSLPVSVELFGTPTYLADSMQFHLEYMLRHDTQGVFYIMQTFRGEDPDARHLNQFFHSEAEIRGDLSDVMSLVGEYVCYLANDFLHDFGDELRRLSIGTSHLEKMIELNGNIPRITFSQACKMLGSRDEFYEPLPGGVRNLSRLGERTVMDRMGGITWLTHLPSHVVPFYQAADEDGIHARCADLLFGIGEVAGCGERHTSFGDTLAALKNHHVNPDEYEWYLRLKREYPMQTSGFGLGVERFLMWLLKHDDIRDMALMNRLKDIQAAP